MISGVEPTGRWVHHGASPLELPMLIRLQADLKTAMLARDAARTQVLRMALAAYKRIASPSSRRWGRPTGPPRSGRRSIC